MAGEVQTGIQRLEYQGIGVRFLALLIGTVVLGIVINLLGGLFGPGWGEMGAAPWWWGLVSFILYIGYYTYLEGSRGQTIGKMAMKIRVVREDGSPIDMTQAFTRNILRVIDGLVVYLIGAVLIWRSERRQRLGDSIARTVVVRA
ncbi:MAG: RDD family protein [Methanothrix sp.]|nr:RDD family protein [Methanothrix sp.]